MDNWKHFFLFMEQTKQPFFSTNGLYFRELAYMI